MKPDMRGLRRTVRRVQARLASVDDAVVAELCGAYATLVPRFEADLGDERDMLPSPGGALVLVQAVAGRRAA